jgi:hypothetical protein
LLFFIFSGTPVNVALYAVDAGVFPVLLLAVDVVGKVALLSVVVVVVVPPPVDEPLLSSVAPLAYIIAEAGKINDIIIKSINKLVFDSMLLLLYLSIYISFIYDILHFIS